jgi:LPS export ABC transporter permease LptG/LPS export ABC transporter permease LptF
MLRIVDRYVLRDLAAPFVIGVGVLTFFLVIDRVYQLTDLVISRGVPARLVGALLLYMLPAFLAFTFPMAILLAVLLVGGRLAADLEVAALTASGVSPTRLARPFLLAAGVVVVASAVLTLVVNPVANRGVQRQLFAILQARAASGLSERVFNYPFERVVIYADQIDAAHTGLRGLLVSDERDPAVSRIIVARAGRLLTDDAQRRLTLRFLDGTIAETGAADPSRFRETAFALYDMNLALDAALSAPAGPGKPERDLGLGALIGRARELRRGGEPAEPYLVELHKRFALPVASLVFVLVGYPLGIRSHRGGRSAALAWSLGIVLAYYVVFTTVEGMALRGRLPPWLAIWLPNALFLLGGVVLLGSLTRVWRPAWRPPVWRLGEGAARRLAGPRRRSLRPASPVHGPRASTFILDRYLVRQYVAFIAVGVAVGAVLLVVVDLLHTLDRFLRLKPPLAYVVQHLLYRLPGGLHQGLPVVVLLATVFLFLSLARQRELDALKAAGVSLYRVSLPVLAMAFAISLGSVAIQELLLPGLNARAEEVDRVKIRGNLPRHLERQSRIWFRGSDTRFYRMELLDPRAQALHGLVVLELDGDFRVARRLDARHARWTPAGWEVSDGVLRAAGPAGTRGAQAFAARVFSFPETIDDFSRVQKRPDAMSFLELRDYVARLGESGRRAGRYLVELYAKLAFPLVHVIMALVAIPFALAAPRAGGRAVGIGIAIIIAVGYWVVHSMALSFARAELLPPALAAWTANVLFAGIGAALFFRAQT